MATTGKTEMKEEDTAARPPTTQAMQSSQEGQQGSNLPIKRERRSGALARSAGTFGPFSMMRRLFDDMERLMGFGSFGSPFEARGLEGSMFVPNVEVMRRDDKLVVNVDLPGMSADDIQVTVQDGALVIEGERHNEHEDREGDVWRCERSYGRFQRVIALPEGADTASAEARFENGVLAISLRAPEQQGGRRIEVKTSDTSSDRSRSATTTH